MEDLEHEAKMVGLKIPNFDNDVAKVDDDSKKDPPKKSSRGRKLKTASCKESVQEKTKPDPRMKKVSGSLKDFFVELFTLV